MRRQRRHSEETSEINMTPMLDIVFIMLIFFIVTSSFVKETGIEVDRPSAHTAQRVNEGQVMIGLSANGEIWINKQPIALSNVGSTVKFLQSSNDKGVTIITDKTTPSGLLIQVMDQIRMMGIRDISIAAKQAKR